MQLKGLKVAFSAATDMSRVKTFEGIASGLRRGRCITISLVVASAAMSMTACSSGNGGDNGVPPPPRPSGLVLTYPYNGQQDVTLNSQIVVKFEQGLSGDAGKSLALRAGSAKAAKSAATITADSDSADDQAGILTITPQGNLAPNTTYYIVATRKLSGTVYDKGDALTRFTTGPMPGRPGPSKQLKVVQTTPGNVNPVTKAKSIFTQFSSVHVVFSEAVDPSTVVAGKTFRFTGAGGKEVPGRLTVIGHELTFDPTRDLAPGSYTLALTKGVVSRFGKPLAPYSATKTVLSAGKTSTENLTVTPASKNVDDLPDNPLDGGPVNLVRISNQLIGLNKQPAMNSPARQGVLTTLAQPGRKAFGKVIPATIRAGQKFQLTPLSLKLNGKIPTPIKSGPIQVQFANDANVYLEANSLSNITTPTMVRLRFDLAISTLIEAGGDQATTLIQSLADGVFNQSVLNIQAAGLAIPQKNGDLRLDTLGTFPILVNRTGQATVDFELSLTLPGGDQTPVGKDKTPPYLVAQSPSACLYTFGTAAYNAAYAQNGAAPTALPEKACLQTLNQGGALDTQSGINSFPVDADPALVFSEPVDPSTVNDSSIQLSYTTANGSSGNTPATYQVDGSSVVIMPGDELQPDAQYTITLGNGASIKDTAGNALTQNAAGGPTQPLKFTTEPLVDSNPTPPLLSELTPGVPCALTGGDYASGGDTAGRCVGDADNGTTDPLPVSRSPANVPVDAYFSKLVAKDSIVLADGCLTGGSGQGNDVSGATVALEEINGRGQCTGTPKAALAYVNSNGDTTRGFSIRPADNLKAGSRYQIVVCGTEDSVCSKTIVDTDGKALNTDPLKGTGSTVANTAAEVAGGPDIRMPFDATAASTDFYTTQFALPDSDTNGNGVFDDASGDGQYAPGGGDERPQPANRALVALSLGSLPLKNPKRDDGLFASYLGFPRPIAIGKTLDDCGAVDAVTDDSSAPVVAPTPKQCIRVALLPGGITEQSSITIQGAVKTGRIILRFPYAKASGDASSGPPRPQSAYIVPKCSGTLADGTPYDYQPCFVTSQKLVANAPDANLISIKQQILNINLIGPVTFEQNGRLVVSLRNVNTFSLTATALGTPSVATIAPGDLHFQLVGNAAHGGRAFPQR